MDFRHPIEAVIPGAQGKVLSAMLGTSAELNLRAIARVAGVSVAQASRVLPGLVELGVIERREIPPSSMFRLIPEHIATRALLDLYSARHNVIAEMARTAKEIRPTPVSVVIFGSFARGDSDTESDIDVVVVRPVGVDEEDARWLAAVETWRTTVTRLAGNSVEILDFGTNEVAAKMNGNSELWRHIRRDGQVVFGQRLDQLAVRRRI